MPTYKNPWPMFTMGCLGEAAAASLIIDHTSCLWPATLFAGLNFSCAILLVVKCRELDASINFGSTDEGGRTQTGNLANREPADISEVYVKECVRSLFSPYSLTQ